MPCLGKFILVALAILVGKAQSQTETIVVRTETVTACENTDLNAACPGVGEFIRIKLANFGRTDAAICPGANSDKLGCEAAGSLDIVKTSCENKKLCTISAANSVFTDPCVGTFKYLIVIYECARTICKDALNTIDALSNGIKALYTPITSLIVQLHLSEDRLTKLTDKTAMHATEVLINSNLDLIKKLIIAVDTNKNQLTCDNAKALAVILGNLMTVVLQYQQLLLNLITSINSTKAVDTTILDQLNNMLRGLNTSIDKLQQVLLPTDLTNFNKLVAAELKNLEGVIKTLTLSDIIDKIKKTIVSPTQTEFNKLIEAVILAMKKFFDIGTGTITGTIEGLKTILKDLLALPTNILPPIVPTNTTIEDILKAIING